MFKTIFQALSHSHTLATKDFYKEIKLAFAPCPGMEYHLRLNNGSSANSQVVFKTKSVTWVESLDLFIVELTISKGWDPVFNTDFDPGLWEEGDFEPF